MEGGRHRQIETAQVAGVDLAVENSFKAGLAFAALQAMFGRTTPAAKAAQLPPLGSSETIGVDMFPLNRSAGWSAWATSTTPSPRRSSSR